MTAEVDDAVGARERRRDFFGAGEIGGDEGLMRLQIRRLDPVAQHQPGIEPGQQGPGHGADAAGGTGEDDSTGRVPSVGHSCLLLPAFDNGRANA